MISKCLECFPKRFFNSIHFSLPFEIVDADARSTDMSRCNMPSIVEVDVELGVEAGALLVACQDVAPRRDDVRALEALGLADQLVERLNDANAIAAPGSRAVVALRGRAGGVAFPRGLEREDDRPGGAAPAEGAAGGC